jgi:hypothetical protein
VFRCRQLCMLGLVLLVGLWSVYVPRAFAQRLQTVIVSHDRVFPAVGAGIAALKRDSAGRYYVLAKPHTVIAVYRSDGELIQQIPNAKSNGAVIRYAEDFDLSPEGRVYIADRGANCIEVFEPDGSLVFRIPVVAPTSLVALSGGQVAVTSLTSKRLVQIFDDRGNLVRSFGEPSDLIEQPQKQSLINLGKISGDSAGGIYFAFTSVPDRTLRKYDRYGYVGYEASVSEQIFVSATEQPDDRVQVSFGFSEFSLSNQTNGSVAFGSSGDVKFNGGMGTGLGEAIRRGYGFGQAVQQQTLSPSGSPGGPIGLLVSGEVTNQGIDFHPGVGTMSARGGRSRNRSSSSDSSDQSTSTPQGTVLQFNSPSGGFSSSDNQDLNVSPDSSDAQSLSMNADNYGAAVSNNGWGMPTAFAGAPTASGYGADVLPGAFGTATLFNSFPFEPGGHAGGFGGAGSSGTPGTEHLHTGGFEARGPQGTSHAGFHGRFGSDVSTFSGKVRVNLGDLGANGTEKPIITAMAVDSETHEVWAAMGNTLVIFSKDGDPIGIFYPTIAGETRLKPVALLVEPDRLLIATDPWGIYEFARPDKLAAGSPRQSSVLRQKNPQQN